MVFPFLSLFIFIVLSTFLLEGMASKPNSKTPITQKSEKYVVKLVVCRICRMDLLKRHRWIGITAMHFVNIMDSMSLNN